MLVGVARTWFSCSSANRPSKALYFDGVHRCLSSVGLFGLNVLPLLIVHSRQISEVPSPGKLYSTLMDLIVRFAHAGLIHGDFNEFNILIRASGQPVVIDFPQMVSTSHENAEW